MFTRTMQAGCLSAAEMPARDGEEADAGHGVVHDGAWVVTLTQRHQYAEALPHLRRALAISEKTIGPDKYETAVTHHNLGDLYMFWSRCAESIPEEEKALAIYEKAVGPNHPDVSYPLENLGACWTELGQPARAVPILERALAIREAAGTGDAAGLAQTLMALADALWKGHGDRARARALAIRARQALDKAGDIGPQEIPAVDKWLAQHR